MKAKHLLIIGLVLATALGFLGVTPGQVEAACPVVTYHFTTFDNGMNGLWAVDVFDSQVTICLTGVNTYQVTFNDNGSSFVTLNAKSPGGDGTTYVAAGVLGTINGGDTVNITGVLKSPLPTSVGPIDFRGDTTQYKYFLPFFDSITSVSYVAWGWTYETCGNGTWVDNAATETQYHLVGPNPLMGDVVGSPAECQNPPLPPAPQWFNPNDGRVDPRPGDRLAVYCNVDAEPPNIVVYGIKDNAPDNKKGFWLATFVNADLLEAGLVGITQSAGDSLVSMMQDGENHFYVAWNGGEYNATGQGDFAKSFTCDFAVP